MTRTAVLITIRAKAGQRDRVRRAWDTHLRQRVEASAAQEAYLVVEDTDDVDVLHLFEVYNDPDAMRANASAPWFAGYMHDVGPLLDGMPQMRTGTPVWGKGLPGW